MELTLTDLVKEFKEIKRRSFKKDGTWRNNATEETKTRYEFLKLKVGHMPETKVDNDADDYEAKRNALTEEDLIGIERNIRRYVKKTGGWRKNLPAEKVEEGKRWLKLLDRDVDNPQWNDVIRVPGFDVGD